MKKRNFSIMIILALLIGGFSISCSSDDSADNFGNADVNDTIPNITSPSPAEFGALRDQALEGITQTATFNAENGIDFTSDKGAHLYIQSSCLTINGEEIQGDVDLTFIELYNRENMLTTNKPVMGLKPNDDKAMLISGGEFYVQVTQDGEPVDNGCAYQLTVPTDLTGGDDNDMILWNGNIDDDGNLTWEEAIDSTTGGAGVFAEEGNYYAWPNDFGWANIDRFYNDPRDKTTMLVSVPEGFDFENSAVYLSYDGEPNALAQLDTFNEDGLFSEHYGQIPIGLEVHIIFVTADGDNWRYAIKGVTITEDETYNFTMDDTQVGSQQELESAIEALP